MDTLGNLKVALVAAVGQRAWEALSLLGEAELLLPLAAGIALVLWRRGRVREAQAWGAGVFLCALTVGVLKLGFSDFTLTVHGHVFNARSFPSGHVATATVFWGGLALLAAPRRWAVLLLLPIPAVATAVLVLWWHHSLDVVAGFAIGAASLGVMLLRLRAPRRSPRSAA